MKDLAVDAWSGKFKGLFYNSNGFATFGGKLLRVRAQFLS